MKLLINKNNVIDASKILFGMILTGRFLDIKVSVIKELTYAVKNNSMYTTKIRMTEAGTKQIVDKFLNKYAKFLVEKNKQHSPTSGTELSSDKVDVDKNAVDNENTPKNKETKKRIFMNRGNVEKHLINSLTCFLNMDFIKFNDIFMGDVKNKLRVNKLYKNNVTLEFNDSELTYLSYEFYKILVKFLKVGA